MKTQINIFNCLVITFFLLGCSEQGHETNKAVSKPLLEWITGDYYFKSNYGDYFESWKKTDHDTYIGLGYFLDKENRDTLFRQRMKLLIQQDGVFMYFNVKNQNDNKDVEFRLTKQENKIYTFENPFRDYPSIVTYKILSDTSVNVVMFGFKNGEAKKENFIITK